MKVNSHVNKWDHGNPNYMLFTSATTVSSTMGIITSTIIDNFKSKFPKDYFKKIEVNTRTASSTVYSDLTNRNENPRMYVEPEFILADDISFQQMPPMYHKINTLLFKNRKDYIPIYSNPDPEFYIYAVPNRLKFNFNIKWM